QRGRGADAQDRTHDGGRSVAPRSTRGPSLLLFLLLVVVLQVVVVVVVEVVVLVEILVLEVVDVLVLVLVLVLFTRVDEPREPLLHAAPPARNPRDLGDCLTSHLRGSVHGATPLAFHLEAEGVEHGERVRVALAGRGEVALHEDGVRGEEGEALRRAERALAPARGPDLGARVGEPEERQRAQTIGRRRRGPRAERGALDRVEEVDRQRGDRERAELARHLDQV